MKIIQLITFEGRLYALSDEGRVYRWGFSQISTDAHWSEACPPLQTYADATNADLRSDWKWLYPPKQYRQTSEEQDV